MKQTESKEPLYLLATDSWVVVAFDQDRVESQGQYERMSLPYLAMDEWLTELV